MELKLIKINDENSIISLHALLAACGKEMYEKLKLMHWHPFMDLYKFESLMRGKDLFGVYRNAA